MKHSSFMSHTIVRSSPPHKPDYKDYRPDLESDFNKRCAYCNLHMHSITTSFEIDHFIPRSVFKNVRPDLENDYNNLMLSCKKCNSAKGAKFHGDIGAEQVSNTRFYDPVTVNLNTVFYRNEYGTIQSDDLKGRSMIRDIKLYRHIHALGWICEQISATIERLRHCIESEASPERKELLTQALNMMNDQYVKKNQVFIARYNDPDFSIESI